MLKQHVLSSDKVGFVDQQIDVTHRPEGDAPIHRFRQIRAFEYDNGDIVLVEHGENLR